MHVVDSLMCVTSRNSTVNSLVWLQTSDILQSCVYTKSNILPFHFGIIQEYVHNIHLF